MFNDVDNTIDKITDFISIMSNWEFATFLRIFKSQSDLAKFALFIYFVRNDKTYDEIIDILKNIAIVVIGSDTEMTPSENCEYCDEGTNMCEDCNGTEELECDECEGSGVDSEGENECASCGGDGNTVCFQCSDGYLTCYECNGNGEIEDEDKTIVEIRTYISYKPLITNYFRANENSVAEVRDYLNNLIPVSPTYQFPVDIKSEFSSKSDFVLRVSQNPQVITDVIFSDKSDISNAYLWMVED